MKKKLTLLVSLLVMTLMFTVGLAAWIITAPTTDNNTQGNINVDTVEEHGWQFVTAWVNEDGTDAAVPTINYGLPGTTPEYSWLTNSTVGAENLVAYLKVTVDKSFASDTVTNAAVVINFTDTATVTDTTKVTAFATAVDAKYASYVIEYQTATTTEGKTTYSYTDTNGTVTDAQLEAGVILRITFKWGTVSGGVNPYTYYNASDYTSA